jgi:hypothetical protein
VSDTSPNLILPYLAAGQAQKHVTVNETTQRLDALVQLAVASATTSAQPASPADGALYVLPAGKTGTQWDGMADQALACYRDGAWEEIARREGWLAYVKDSDQLVERTRAHHLALERHQQRQQQDDAPQVRRHELHCAEPDHAAGLAA